MPPLRRHRLTIHRSEVVAVAFVVAITVTMDTASPVAIITVVVAVDTMLIMDSLLPTWSVSRDP